MCQLEDDVAAGGGGGGGFGGAMVGGGGGGGADLGGSVGRRLSFAMFGPVVNIDGSDIFSTAICVTS